MLVQGALTLLPPLKWCEMFTKIFAKNLQIAKKNPHDSCQETPAYSHKKQERENSSAIWGFFPSLNKAKLQT